jgi:hypothetical protein
MNYYGYAIILMVQELRYSFDYQVIFHKVNQNLFANYVNWQKKLDF